MKTAQQAAANWANSAPRAQSAWQEGVTNYSGDWAGATTRQKTVMQQNLQAAWARGAWENGINRVGTNGWKQATTNKAGNFGTGFAAGAQKQAASIAKILNAESTIVSGLAPRGDFTANKARMNSVVDQLHALKGTLGA